MINKPTLGALVLYYILAFGMIFLFGPSAYFYLQKVDTEGEITRIVGSQIYVNYKDDIGEEYIAEIIMENNDKKLKIGEEVKVYFRKGKPTDFIVPDLHGKEPYLLYYIFLLLVLFAVYIKQINYLKK